ncbi:ATP-binding protein [[Eubacterium] cellulosolvens]
MKIAIAGKGGVGKTFVAGTLSRLLARDGYKVIAVDADPAMNLAYALGIPSQKTFDAIPISENKNLIEERVGSGPIINLNPSVNDIAEQFGITGPDNVILLIMGTVRSGGSGCMCNANSLISALIRHITLQRKDLVIADMEAGLEHLGRATVKGFDVLICIVEPGAQSIETARKILKLASDLKIKNVIGFGNKIDNPDDKDYIQKNFDDMGIELISSAPFDNSIVKADNMRIAPIDFSPNSVAINAVIKLKEFLEKSHL